MADRTIVERASGASGAAVATFDPSRTYRFRLSRTWAPDAPVVTFVMLNPSTADAHRLDPTVRRCVGFARSRGFGGLEVVNLFAYRATDPSELFHCREPVGPGNDRAVLDAATGSGLVVAAWGNGGGHRGRGQEVAELLAGRGVATCALGRTARGHPRHPLYVRADVRPVPWRGTTSERGGSLTPLIRGNSC
jgi:hypothetical protein